MRNVFIALMCIADHCCLQQFPASATTLHFEYYEELDETKAEKKVCLPVLQVQYTLY